MPETAIHVASHSTFDFQWSLANSGKSKSRGSAPAERTRLAMIDAHVAAIAGQTPDCIETVDRQGRTLFATARVDPTNKTGESWIKPWSSDTKAVSTAAITALQSCRSAGFEGSLRSTDATCWSVTVPPRTGARSPIVGRKASADRQELARQKLINAELQHRIKNTLTVVQSLVSQTLIDGVSLEDARRILSDRLSALASATGLLTRTDTQALPLAAVVIAAVAFIETAPGRIVVDGPALTVGPSTAIMLTMALHELGTNAVKYGALSGVGGHVDFSWRQLPHDDGRRIELRWAEHGGPAVSPPTRRGFGSRLVGRVTERQLHGHVAQTFDPSGVV